MTIIAKEDVVNKLNKIFLMYENHIIKEKLRLLKKKYSVSLDEFEKNISQKNSENFEEWDDYIEWKAYNKKDSEISNELIEV